MKAYNGFPASQRQRALNWLKAEIAAGRRQDTPLFCEACGQPHGSLEWHSEDYGEPFGDHIGAYGLCYPCHMMIHCRHRQPARWREYRDLMRTGWRPAPFYTRNWPLFRALFLVSPYIPEASLERCNLWVGAGELGVLDDIHEGRIRGR